jgi:hypothetical protein
MQLIYHLQNSSAGLESPRSAFEWTRIYIHYFCTYSSNDDVMRYIKTARVHLHPSLIGINFRQHLSTWQFGFFIIILSCISRSMKESKNSKKFKRPFVKWRNFYFFIFFFVSSHFSFGSIGVNKNKKHINNNYT